MLVGRGTLARAIGAAPYKSAPTFLSPENTISIERMDVLARIPNMDPFERPAWTGKEIAPGVTDMERQWPHVTYDSRYPQIHYHFWQDDVDLDVRGWGASDIVCHGCGRGTRVLFPASAEANSLLDIRDRFIPDHVNHLVIGGDMLCPPEYSLIETVDRR